MNDLLWRDSLEPIHMFLTVWEALVRGSQCDAVWEFDRLCKVPVGYLQQLSLVGRNPVQRQPAWVAPEKVACKLGGALAHHGIPVLLHLERVLVAHVPPLVPRPKLHWLCSEDVLQHRVLGDLLNSLVDLCKVRRSLWEIGAALCLAYLPGRLCYARLRSLSHGLAPRLLQRRSRIAKRACAAVQLNTKHKY